MKHLTFRLCCASKTYAASFMFLTSAADARLQLLSLVEKALLHKPCGGVRGKQLIIYLQ